MKELKTLQRLTEAFHKLPGIGLKSAERMAFSVLALPAEDVEAFSQALIAVKSKIKPCPICGVYTEQDLCDVCASKERNHDVCIVVSYPKDVLAFEKMEHPQYIYHVLGGVLSPTKGVGVDDLNIDTLFKRIAKEKIKEIVLATNPTLEGETTALFLAKLLEKYPVAVTRIGYGLPMGGHLDYADSLTLSKALKGRTKVKGE